MQKQSFIIHPIKPFYDADAEVLILGSFPSVKSREQGFFYGHPQNRFWKVLAAVFSDTQPETIDEKKRFLTRHHIALWDVIRSCEITGSSDSSIRNVKENDLRPLFEQTGIHAVFVNGKTAEKYYRKYILPRLGIRARCLPSTSPANAAWSPERLTAAWQVVADEANRFHREKMFWLRPGKLEVTKQAVLQTGLAEDSSVLDIGCGQGIALQFIHGLYGCRAYGIDAEACVIMSAGESLPEGAFCVGTAEALPYEDDFFDLVLMECVLTVLDDPQKALQEALRVLKPGGKLSVSAPVRRKHREDADRSVLIRQGLMNTDPLIRCLESAGMQHLLTKEMDQALLQFYADILFRYGGLEAYRDTVWETCGVSVFCCDTAWKDAGYEWTMFLKR